MVQRPARGGASGPRVQTISIRPPQAASSRPDAPESKQSSAKDPEKNLEEDFNKLSLASLTEDTPFIPLRKPRRVPATPFLFLTLPSELRLKIYEYFFDGDPSYEAVLDLGPDNYKRYHRKLGLMRVNRQVHDEATHYFYSTRTFRIFPTHPGRYFKTKRPLLTRLKKNQRQCLQSLELRLGPGWSAPPRGWAVNDALGLADCTNVHTLNVFVECDPSDGVFKGFRRSEGFYEGFSRNLLTSVMDAMPSLNALEFDAWSSVKKRGAMMQGLLDVAKRSGHDVCWGSERGWDDSMSDHDEPVKDKQATYADGLTITISGYNHNVLVSA